MMEPTLQQQVAAAGRCLIPLRSAFDEAARALAQRCAPAGRLDTARLDAEQIASFELAWAAADLLAAENALASLRPGSADLDLRLALLFAAEAAAGVLGRVETLFAELGVADSALDAL